MNEWKEEIKKHQERQDQLLEIYEAGVKVRMIAEEMGISKARVYQIINKAKARREKAKQLQERTLEADQ